MCKDRSEELKNVDFSSGHRARDGIGIRSKTTYDSDVVISDDEII